MLGFFLAGAALALTAGLVAATLRLRSPVVFAVAWWVLLCAEVVGAAELLSLVHGLRPLGYALVETAALALAAATWLRAGRPRPPLPRVPRSPLVVALTVAVVLGCAY